MLNGLGRTKYEELFVLWHHLSVRLKEAGLMAVAPEVGEFVTSLDMEGCSLSILWLDDQLADLWQAPADTPAFRRGTVRVTGARQVARAAHAQGAVPKGARASAAQADCVAGIMGKLAEALAEAEAELGRIDAVAGDGDHGQGMARGSLAAAAAARDAAAQGAGAGTVLALAGDAWADRAGGTSGALWGVALRAWGQALGDTEAPDAERIAAGARAGLEAVIRLGRAQPGDKTLVDAFAPFVEELQAQVGRGVPMAAAWQTAAARATKAAEATAALTPRLGRARPLAQRSIGHPDAGAISLALCTRVVAGAFSTNSGRPKAAQL